MDLNPPQQAAVDHGDGPLLVLAGAGSGKTRVITHRLATLVRRGVRPWRILAVTFTNKAAGEMRERAGRLLGDEARAIWIGTFHATCAKLLRIYCEAAGLRPGFLIFDDADQRSLIVRIMKDFNVSDRVATPRALLSAIDRAKNAGVSSSEYRGEDFLTDIVAKVYPEYQLRLRSANAVDFGDLILEVLRLTRHPEVGPELGGRFDHVLVDEFQDTNQVQYLLVAHLARRTGNLCVVGDDDQSIYRWRGATVENILGFDRDQPGCTTIKLEQNYRSTQTILDAANGVISRNRGRHPKRLFTEQGPGEPILYYTAADERREAEFVTTAIKTLSASGERSPSDFAVFYRTHAQSRVLEEAMRNADLPYVVVGGMRFFDRAEVKDLIAYLRVVANRDDEVSLDRIVNVPSRGIGDTTLDRVRELGAKNQLSYWEAMKRATSPAIDLLGVAPRKKLHHFVHLMDELTELSKSSSLSELAEAILERSGYLERLAIDGSKESRDRLGNLQELVGAMRDYEREVAEPSLVDWLERVALASPVDGETRGAVALMTVHGAKGLEFPVVFVTGLEEGTFPRVDPGDEPEELEEERRLAYVAITRARERLFLSNAVHRRLFGRELRVTSGTPLLDPSDPYAQRESRFIADIPEECIARPVPARRAAAQRPSPWRRPLVGRAQPPRIESRDDGSYVEREPVDDEPARAAAPVRAPQTDTWVEYDDEGAMPYRLGQRVRHGQFGVGEVRACTGRGPGLKLTVYFPSAGTKTVVARFVEPA